jgi:hypothetical protein
MHGCMVGSASIFRNLSGIFISPISRSTPCHHLANPASDYLGLSADGIGFTIRTTDERSNNNERGRPKHHDLIPEWITRQQRGS